MDEKQKKMVVENRRLVHYIVRKMGFAQQEYDDIVSIGTIGLIKAVSTFNEEKSKFATYASRCISNEIFMYYRKEKHHLNEISLEEPISIDMSGNELSIADVFPESEETLQEQVEAYDNFSNAISFILNVLEGKEKIVTLYLMAGLTQNQIFKEMGLSQSYISRLAGRAHKKIRNFLSNPEYYEEVFNVSIGENLYKISFSSTDVKNFNNIFSLLIRGWNLNKMLPSFKITCTSERISIILPAIEESFAFIAEIINAIDNYAMKTISESNLGSISEETGTESTKAGESTNNTAVDNLESTSEKVETEPTKRGESTNDTAVDNVGSTSEEAETEPTKTGESTNDTAESNSSKDSKLRRTRKGTKIEMIRSYILSLDEFTVEDLRQKFPEAESAIPNALTYCKSKGFISSKGKGKYSVLKRQSIEEE